MRGLLKSNAWYDSIQTDYPSMTSRHEALHRSVLRRLTPGKVWSGGRGKQLVETRRAGIGQNTR